MIKKRRLKIKKAAGGGDIRRTHLCLLVPCTDQQNNCCVYGLLNFLSSVSEAVGSSFHASLAAGFLNVGNLMVYLLHARRSTGAPSGFLKEWRSDGKNAFLTHVVLKVIVNVTLIPCLASLRARSRSSMCLGSAAGE